jgi:hypothetical protein
MFKKLSWIALILLTISLLFISIDISNTATAQIPTKSDNIVFILDNSGSMKEMDDTPRIKIDAAIDVVQRNIDNKSLLATNMGLVVLGGNCESKVLVDLNSGESNRTEIKSKLNSIDHRKSTSGSTPIVDAIDKALGILQYKQGNRRIILVSDGLPNCNQPNACDSVKKWDDLLLAKGIKFDMQIIGYGIKQNNDKEFKCIKNLSEKFSYISVNNETELKEAFNKSVSKSFSDPTIGSPSGNITIDNRPVITITNGGYPPLPIDDKLDILKILVIITPVLGLIWSIVKFITKKKKSK